MFRIVSLNVNGLRSAASKGLMAWIGRNDPDLVCLQEVKAHQADLPEALLRPSARYGYFHCAQAKGYSGTAIYTKKRPQSVRIGFGDAEFDREGRYVEAQFSQVTVISVYFPSGSSSPERQEAKFRFLDAFFPHLAQLRASGREVILCGDVNIAHQPIDLKNWRANQKNSGFLPQERAWLGRLFDEHGWVDVFRRLDARPEQYTWWSNRGRAWENNVGWRIDYQIATPGASVRAQRVEIYKKQRFSDHAPLIVDYSGRL
ncbi:AP endonuclease, family 1:Exodeoxyribonuclease III xth [Burkholderiales bacterium]|nr:AP endonuclease, family 1:Exodeoxyribonuclease III xth [Burkholderiales bacterium]